MTIFESNLDALAAAGGLEWTTLMISDITSSFFTTDISSFTQDADGVITITAASNTTTAQYLWETITPPSQVYAWFIHITDITQPASNEDFEINITGGASGMGLRWRNATTNIRAGAWDFNSEFGIAPFIPQTGLSSVSVSSLASPTYGSSAVGQVVTGAGTTTNDIAQDIGSSAFDYILLQVRSPNSGPQTISFKARYAFISLDDFPA